MILKWTVIVLNIFICGIECENINIGSIFEEDSNYEDVFKYAIERINKMNQNHLNLVPLSEMLHSSDGQKPLTSLNITCNLLGTNTFGIVGPKDIDNINVVQSVCDEKEVPHILYRWIHKPPRSGTIINLYPHAEILSKVYFDIISAWNWKTFTILYENNESLLRLADLIQVAKEKEIVVIIRQLVLSLDLGYRPVLKEAKKSGQQYFVLDCEINNLRIILQQIQEVGLMSENYNYLLTNLNTHTEELSSFQYSDANITGIRLINPESQYVREISEELFESDSPIIAWQLRTEQALIVDAIDMYAKALFEIMHNEDIVTSAINNKNLDCEASGSWEQGLSIINLMKTSSHYGLTGNIGFNNQGYRSEFELELYELKDRGIITVGTWNSTTGLNITRVFTNTNDVDNDSLRNKTFTVITTLTEPYGMLKDTPIPLYGNDRFEGFSIDLIHELALMEGFNYTFIIREDKANGKMNPETKKWSGMIGDIIEGTADLAIADLTINSQRAEAVDFTTPYMNLGISILFRKPEKAPPSFFSFAEPFANDTWLMLSVSFIVVSMSLFVLGRLCPEEWQNPYPCIEEPEYLVNQFSLSNSFWFTTGSLMCQGSEIAPIAVSTRMVAGMWWFFVLIIIASYTANLAAFLSTENAIELFTNVQSLVENSEKHHIKFGALDGGSTATFFKDSSNPIYKKISNYMEKHPEDMVKENQKGVEKAEKERYAFFMESTSIKYVTERHCDLQMYGNLLDDKGYGIAMKKQSPFRNRLSTAILKLQSSGVIEDLRRKWWEERRGGGQCGGESEVAEATAMDLVNVEGVFWVTIGGSICSIFVVIIHLLVNVYNRSKKAKRPFKELLKIEIKDYLNFDSNVKEVTKEQSQTPKTSKSRSASLRTNKTNGSLKQVNGKSNGPQYGFILSPSIEKLAEEL